MENVRSNDAKAPVARTPRPEGNRAPRSNNDRPRRDARPQEEIFEQVVNINRVSKTTKGGRTMRFTALVVVGDKKGRVGYGTGKSVEVPTAIKKAIQDARNNMVRITMVGPNTIPHEVTGKAGASAIFMKQAPEGTGVIAGASARAVLELAGVHNIYTKAQGSRTAINVVAATINGLTQLKRKDQVAQIRGVNL